MVSDFGEVLLVRLYYTLVPSYSTTSHLCLFNADAYVISEAAFCMNDDRPDSGENPLDDFASHLSDSLDSKAVNVNDASADRVEGGQVHMDGSIARRVYGRAVHMDGSAAGFLRADVVDIDDSVVGLLAGKQTSAQDVNSFGFIAQKAEARNISSFIFLAGRVEGKVRAVFTPASALAFGAGFGLVFLVTRKILSRLWPFKRRKRTDIGGMTNSV